MADRTLKPGKQDAGDRPCPADGGDPFFGLSGLVALNEQNVRAMSDAGAQWLKAVEALQKEIVEFAGKRASEGAAHAEALLRCRSAQDVVFRQTEHVRHMMEDYLGEVQKLLTVWLEASTPKKPAAKREGSEKDGS